MRHKQIIQSCQKLSFFIAKFDIGLYVYQLIPLC